MINNDLPRFEHDPVETVRPRDPTAKITFSNQPTIEQLLMHLIEVQIDLTNTMNDLVISHYALVEALAGEPEDDEDGTNRFKTLGGEEP